MKRFMNLKWLLMIVLMLSLTTVDADAQRRHRRSRSRVSSNYRANVYPIRVVQEGGYTNIRATPNGRIVAKVKDGSYIYINGDYTDSGWMKVFTSSGKFRGYIHWSKLEMEDPRGSDIW